MKIFKAIFPLLFILSACAQKGASAPRSDTAPASQTAIKVETIAEGLEFPWGMAFLPNGDVLVTEKIGRLRLIHDGKLIAEPINGVPSVLFDGQAGLFDVALHPDFASNNYIYLSFAKGTENDNATNLVRAKLVGNHLEEITQIFEASPHKKGTGHFGGRILFINNNRLLLSLGEGFHFRNEAQNPQSDLGKIVLLQDDGSPLGNVPNWRPEIYSMGHRNVQGLARDAKNGITFGNEHGPRGGDEINIIMHGSNYGWPVVTYGIDYSGLPISDKVAQNGMEPPLVYWVPSIAPSSMTFYDKDLFPNFKGDLLVTALAGMQIRHIDLEIKEVSPENRTHGRYPYDVTVQKEETLLSDMQTRFRNIVTAPDGSLWILTDEPEGRVLRLSPK